MTFAELNLAPSLLEAIDALGYTAPTPVQQQTIPAAMQGGDWMVSSQTGSGKTAAFLLPALNALLANPPKAAAPQREAKNSNGRYRRAPGVSQPSVLVLCPTRELAQQVAQEAITLVRFSRGIRIATVLGGTAYMLQLQALEGASLVVATPGRLLDLHRNGQIKLDAVDTLVVDEADRMLDLGFSEDLEAIHQATVLRERTLMFSATFAPRIMALASAVMRDPQKIELVTAHDTHENIEQRLHWVDDQGHKAQLLEHYLNQAGLEQAVVFTSTQIETDALSDQLRAAGYRASALHGGLPQPMRNRRIKSLREGHIQILVATDVAARGIDVPAISHVINYGLPMKPEDYVHRIGRTGRAGRSGVAITLASARERHKIRNIEYFTQQRLDVTTVAGLEPKATAASKPRFDRNAPRGRNERFSSDAARRTERNERPAYREGGATAGGSPFSGPTATPARTAYAARPPEPREIDPRRERYAGAERGERPARFERGDRSGGFARNGRFERNDRGPANDQHRARSGSAKPEWQGRPSTRPPFAESRADTRPHASGDAPRYAPRTEPTTEQRSEPRFEQRGERRPFGGRADRTAAPEMRTRRASTGYAPVAANAEVELDEFTNAKPAPRKFVDRAAPAGAAAPTRPRENRDVRSNNTDAPRESAPVKSVAKGPAVTPPHPDGNRAARRAKLQALSANYANAAATASAA